MTLLGASLAVVSSTALYINMGVFFVLGGIGKPFWTNPYLSIFVFGINLGSVLNDIGMLLVCSVLKKVDSACLVKRVSTVRPPRFSVKPASQLQSDGGKHKLSGVHSSGDDSSGDRYATARTSRT